MAFKTEEILEDFVEASSAAHRNVAREWLDTTGYSVEWGPDLRAKRDPIDARRQRAIQRKWWAKVKKDPARHFLYLAQMRHNYAEKYAGSAEYRTQVKARMKRYRERMKETPELYRQFRDKENAAKRLYYQTHPRPKKKKRYEWKKAKEYQRQYREAVKADPVKLAKRRAQALRDYHKNKHRRRSRRPQEGKP